MFPMTPALKEHLVKSFGLKADATDDEAKKMAFAKLATGELTDEKVKELTSVGAKDKAAELADTIAKKTAEAVGAALAPLAEVLKAQAPAQEKKSAEPAIEEFQKEIKRLEKSFEERMEERLKARASEDGIGPKAFAILKAASVGGENCPVSIHVKGVQSKFSTTKQKLTRSCKTRNEEHKLIRRHGSHGDVMEGPSEFDKMMGSVWCKYLLSPEHLTENDQMILAHILHKEKFIIHGYGADSAIVNPEELFEAPRILNEKERRDMVTKATVLIADNTSGGNYATPEFFDTNFILLPILGSELAPLCNIVDVPRGTAAQNFTMGNPSWTSGSTEGSAVTPFTTDSFIGNHDTTFYRAAGAIKLGINFMQDAVPGIAEAIIGRIMAKANEWLDEQVAIGDGTTEPEGIFTASGTTNVTIATPTTGPYVLADFTELLFALDKAYRTAYPSNRAAFVMTDHTYYLVRSIATGVTGDTRLIFGDDVESYMLFNHPVAIVATGLTNDQFAFMQCGGYRLYRRQGPRFVRSTEGSTNILANQMLVAYDMRFGGSLDRGGYAAVETSGIT